MLEDLKQLLRVDDPVERGLRATELINEYQGAVTELARVRKEAIEELRREGKTQVEVARLLGLTRARVSQLAKSGPPVERAFLGTGPLKIAVALKKESEYGRPAVAQETVEGTTRLQVFARTLELDAELEYVTPPGIVDLNRDNLVVMIGPRFSSLVAQILESDTALKFRKDEQGWHLLDQRAGVVHRSPMDLGENGCVGYLGRFQRPDQQRTFLYMAGVHAMGLQGVIHYVEDNLTSLYDAARLRRFSMAIKCRFDPQERQVVSSERLTPIYRHGEV